MDLSSMLASGKENTDNKNKEAEHERDAVYSDGSDLEMASSAMSSITENNLTDFKAYLDDENSEIHDYIGENGIVYSYNTSFNVYTHDTEDTLVNVDGVTIDEEETASSSSMMSSMSSMSSMMGSSSNFEEMLPGTNGEMISPVVTDSYDVLYGSWPSNYDEVVLALDSNNEISTTTLYELGLLPSSEYEELMAKINDGEEVTLETQSWSYEEICAQELYLLSACDAYVENEDGTFTYVGGSASKLELLLDSAIKMKITAVIRPAEDADNASISSAIGYTQALTDYIIAHTENSAIVQAQMADKTVNVLNGLTFSPADDAQKVEDAKIYLDGLTETEKADMCREILESVYEDDPETTQMMLDMTDTELAATLDEYILSSDDPEDERLLMIYETYISTGSYEDNLEAFGVVSYDAPFSISIYSDSFEDKEAITDCIDTYNSNSSEEDQISYTDYVGLLMSSITTIVNVISYVLIAFVAVSLIVSSIMIGIITYISVLERTKEIGILRAIGASKHNISQMFNAETFIVGLCAGLIGIGVTLLLLIPGNAVIHAVAGTTSVSASLPVTSAVLLVILSVILTLIGGLLPSRKAAKKDPVTALRTE